MPSPAPGHTPGDPSRDPHRPDWRRRGQLASVALGVLLVHAWLIGPMREPLGHAPARAPAIEVVTLPPPAAPQPAPDRAGPEPVAPQTPPEPPALLTAPEPLPQGTPTIPPTRHPPPDQPIDWTAGALAPEAVAGTEPAPAEDAASAPAAPVPGPVASAQAPEDGGGHPPLYTSQPPTRAFKLEYRIERGDEAGTGSFSLEFLPDGEYRARLAGAIGNKALMDWVSRGRVDAAGIAPLRMVERQRGVEVRAVNFQRDKGVISFSGSTRALSLFAGAQDRVSLLLQLAAIAQAQPGGLQAGQSLRLQVANARGQATEWVFEVLGEERVEPHGTPLRAVHLQREPTQPYDQRVEVWLAPEAGHLPVGLRFTQVPGRASEAFWLSSPLPAPEAASAAASRP
ncbi:DUF3108 domain-containing protein [Ideonella sp. YS5]|uniref:DUF3108 domain-containing protein n=1 Tax=Ideonella sp. YS5 TaxID=3453714 RepID=UPI003EE9C98C